MASPPRDDPAFRAMFEREFGVVHRFVAARAGIQAADDLTAEVFLTAHRRGRPGDSDPAGERAWLLGTAVNVVRNHARGRRRHMRMLGRLRAEPPVDATGDIVARLDADADAARLARALGTLRGGDRDAFLLHVWTELTYEEVAVALDVPVGTVRSRISRARSRLRAALESRPSGDATVTEAR